MVGVAGSNPVVPIFFIYKGLRFILEPLFFTQFFASGVKNGVMAQKIHNDILILRKF